MKNKSVLKPIWKGLAFFFVLLLSANSFAQQGSIKGNVVDKTGTPLPGVSIVVQGTTRGTQTDIDGNFAIDAAVGDKLAFSYIGMKSLNVTLSSLDSLSITMQEDAANLDEVVVIGYGSRKRGDLIGSVATVDPEQMTKVATSDIGEMIRGQVAGVQVTLNDGGPGSTSNILIRGKSSVNGGNDPLVIVDGVPVGAINDINPNDIETLNILKDAASLAIYGARASNGVILITTKRGKVGKSSIAYNGATGIQTINRNFDIYSGDEFAQLKREAFRTSNLGVYQNDEDIFSALQLGSINSGEYIDWEDLIINTGITHNHNLSVSTGTEKTSIYSSFNIFNQEGVVANTLFNRVTGRVNIDQRINDWFKMGANVSLQYSKETGPDVGNILLRSITTSPLGQVFNEDGTLRLEPEGFEENKNPLIDLQEVTTIRNNRNDILNVFFDLTPFKGFNYRLNLSRRSWNNKNRNYASSQSVTGIANNNRGQGSLEFQDNVEWQWENIATFNTGFGTENHSLGITGVHSFTDSNYNRYFLDVNNVPNDILGIYGLEAAESTQSFISGNNRNLLSLAFRAEYSYKSKYYLMASARADASSIFGAKNKWGYFPSVGVSWNAHNENFLREIEAINNLKFSVSYGQVGNQDARDNNNNPLSYPSIASANQLEYIIDGIKVSGYAPGASLSNPDLKWETTTTLNAKVDFSIYNRINSTVEFYNSRTTDLFFNRGLPANTGYSNQLVNLGEVENQGIEITLDTDIIKKKDFRVNLGLSYTRNENKIISLYGEDSDGDGIEDDDVANRLFIGKPIDVFYQYQAIGIWQEGEDIVGGTMPDARPGDYKLLDVNGDGIFDPNSNDDRLLTEAGPEWFGSAFLNIDYKGLDFAANLNTVQGVTRYNGFLAGYTEGGSLRGIKNGIKQNYWTPENPTGDFPRPNEANDPNFLFTNALQDASFIRLQNVTLGYSLPQDVLSDLGLTKFRLYLTGSNLITITDFESFSPEKRPNEYPEPVTILVGLQLGL